jgi:thioredoxin reductase (NADPH)
MPETIAAGQASHEAVIIGAGPAGLWAAFQLGIHGVRSVIIDSGHEPGGQCAALYADKPVFDVPGFAAIDAGDLVARLAAQVERFEPQFHLGELVTTIEQVDSGFSISTRSGLLLNSTYVVLASGLGPFPSDVKHPAIALPASVHMEDGHVSATTDTFETSCDNLFAVGDAVTYPGKLCLLVSACHEAALMAFAIRRKRGGDKRVVLGYSSTSSAVRALFTDR